MEQANQDRRIDFFGDMASSAIETVEHKQSKQTIVHSSIYPLAI
jgi:hypothetical protein